MRPAPRTTSSPADLDTAGLLDRLRAARGRGPAAIALDGDGTLWSPDIGHRLVERTLAARRLLPPSLAPLQALARRHALPLADDPHDQLALLIDAYRAGTLPPPEAFRIGGILFAGHSPADARAWGEHIVAELGPAFHIAPAWTPILTWARAADIDLWLISAGAWPGAIAAARRAGIPATRVIACTYDAPPDLAPHPHQSEAPRAPRRADASPHPNQSEAHRALLRADTSPHPNQSGAHRALHSADASSHPNQSGAHRALRGADAGPRHGTQREDPVPGAQAASRSTDAPHPLIADEHLAREDPRREGPMTRPRVRPPQSLRGPAPPSTDPAAPPSTDPAAPPSTDPAAPQTIAPAAPPIPHGPGKPLLLRARTTSRLLAAFGDDRHDLDLLAAADLPVAIAGTPAADLPLPGLLRWHHELSR